MKRTRLARKYAASGVKSSVWLVREFLVAITKSHLFSIVVMFDIFRFVAHFWSFLIFQNGYNQFWQLMITSYIIGPVYANSPEQKSQLQPLTSGWSSLVEAVNAKMRGLKMFLFFTCLVFFGHNALASTGKFLNCFSTKIQCLQTTSSLLFFRNM